jgi:Mg2+ and Co2+ transporter CorA
VQVSLRLDISRNENLIANTALAVLSCSIAFGAYITGIFGMNLDQTIYLQPKKGSFVGVTVASFAVIVVIFVVVYGYFRHTGVIPRRTGFSTASQRLGRK